MRAIWIIPVIVSILVLGSLGFSQEAEAATFTATQNGNWNDAATWGGAGPPINIASLSDKVTIPSGITVTIIGSDIITNSGTIHNFGTIDNFGTLTTNPEPCNGCFVRIINFGTINNEGTINISSSLKNLRENSISDTATINNSGEIIINNSGEFNNFDGIINNSGLILNSGGITNSNGIINNDGTINNSDVIFNFDSGTINNSGEINNFNGNIFNQGFFNNSIGGVIDNFGIISNLEDFGFGNPGIINNSGTIINNSGSHIVNDGIINNDSTINNTAGGGLDNTIGTINSDCNGVINGPVIGNQPVDVCDSDGDGSLDVVDNCPGISNSDQADSNGNGIGDACEGSIGATCGVGTTQVGDECEADVTQAQLDNAEAQRDAALDDLLNLFTNNSCDPTAETIQEVFDCITDLIDDLANALLTITGLETQVGDLETQVEELEAEVEELGQPGAPVENQGEGQGVPAQGKNNKP